MQIRLRPNAAEGREIHKFSRFPALFQTYTVNTNESTDITCYRMWRTERNFNSIKRMMPLKSSQF